MSFIKRKKSLSISLVSVLMILTVSLFLFSCAKDYDTSDQIAAARVDPKIDVMISPSELNNWLTDGYPGDIYGNNKVVVLFVGTQDQYDAGHIPGSQLVSYGDIKSDRSDGVSMTIDMVATKAQMDAVIQRTGIDGGTVIVITGPRNINGTNYNAKNFPFMNTARAYYNFRYWGFPRSKLRVLDGFVNTTWADAGYTLEFEAPTSVEPSTFSVCNLKQDPDRFRAPLEKMINVAKDTKDTTVVVDTRSDDEYNGKANSTAGSESGKYVAFEGHIKGAVHQEYTNLLDSDGKLKDYQGLADAMDAIGVNKNTTAYPYCRTSWRAAITFLALDGVLNYPVKLYDGAWVEWGQMTATQYGALDPNSKWTTDITWATVVDNASADFSVAEPGTWNTSITARTGPYYGKDFRYIAAGSGLNSATWTPSLLSAANYEVYIWHTANGNYATDATFTITHSGTTDTVTNVDLTKNGGTWYKLGTYAFNADGSENVTLTDEANGYVVADAVAFLPAWDTLNLSDSVTYNTNVGQIKGNSSISNADNVNRTDEEICAIEGPSGGGGGAGGGGDSGAY